MNGRAAFRFWLLWALMSSLGSGFGVVLGLIPAYIVGAVTVASVGNSLGWPLGLAAGAVADGLLIGVAVGNLQALLLPWPREVRWQWTRRSIVGWTVGPALGCLAGFVPWPPLFGSGGTALSSPYAIYLLEIATPVCGLTLGLALRSVPPGRPVLWVWWLVAHMLAVSGGWLAGRLLAGQPSFFGLTWPALILGPLCYGAVSGLLMLKVIQDGARMTAIQTDDTGATAT